MSEENSDWLPDDPVPGTGMVISDEQRKKQQDIKRSRTVDAMEKKWQDANRADVEAAAARVAPPVISEPRCHVCQSPHRLFIERQLLKGMAYSKISEYFPPDPETGKKLDRRSISNHYKEHMSLDDAIVRGVLEEEAGLLGQNIEEGIAGAFSMRGALNVLVRKAYDDAINNVTTVEPRDMIQMIKLFNEMEGSSSVKLVEEAKASVSIFMAAIQNVFQDLLEPELADELSRAIVAEVRRLREQNEIEGQIENNLRQIPRG